MKQFLGDHVVLIGIIIAVSMLLLLFPVGPLLGSILYFGLPSTYLVFRKPAIFNRTLLPVISFGFLCGIGFEYLNEVGGSWIFPRAEEFVFPNLFFGIVPGDVMVWYVLWIFMIVTYYQYFFAPHSSRPVIYRRVTKALGLAVLALGIITIFEYGLNTSLVIPYTYTITGLATFIPVYVLYKRKSYIFPRLFKTIPFLAAFFLLMEAVALSVGYWEFVGGSPFLTIVAGHLIPVEEIIFWILGSPLIITAYHELFLGGEV